MRHDTYMTLPTVWRRRRTGTQSLEELATNNAKVRKRLGFESAGTRVALLTPGYPYRTVIQLDRVVMTLEVMLRSSAPHAFPTTLRAFFDSPG